MGFVAPGVPNKVNELRSGWAVVVNAGGGGQTEKSNKEGSMFGEWRQHWRWLNSNESPRELGRGGANNWGFVADKWCEIFKC